MYIVESETKVRNNRSNSHSSAQSFFSSLLCTSNHSHCQTHNYLIKLKSVKQVDRNNCNTWKSRERVSRDKHCVAASWWRICSTWKYARDGGGWRWRCQPSSAEIDNPGLVCVHTFAASKGTRKKRSKKKRRRRRA